MAYEPVLAPTVMTGDSTLNIIGESGFKHYLRTISKSLSSSTTPETPKSISATFVIPQSEVSSAKTFSTNRFELKESGRRSTPPIVQASPGIMASAVLATASETDNVFPQSELSSSALSSSFESPHFSSSNNIEGEGVQETVQGPLENSALNQAKSQLNSQTHGGQTIGNILKNLFRRRGNSTVRIAETLAPQSKPVRRPFFHSSGSLAKDIESPQTTGHSQSGVINLRSIEVSPYLSDDKEVLTTTRHLSSSRPTLHTTSLQSAYIESCPKSAPKYVVCPTIRMNIGKVETVYLASAPYFCKRRDSEIRQRTSVASVFINLETPNKSLHWQNKSTSPFTIPHSLVQVSSKPDVVDIEEQDLPEPVPWCQDDPDPTQLSTPVELESDVSIELSDDSFIIESEGLYEPVNKKPAHLPFKNGDLQGSTSVCIAESPSEITVIFGAKSSADSSDFTMTKNQNVRGQWRKDESSFNRQSIVSDPTSMPPLQPSPPSISNLRNHQGYQGENTPADALKLANSAITATLDRQMRKQKTKTPPSAVFRRNRDIVNGVQSPQSHLPGSSLSIRKSSADESNSSNQSTPIINEKLSQSVSPGHNQNDKGESYLSRGRLQDLPILDSTDERTGGVASAGFPPISPKTITVVSAVNNRGPANPCEVYRDAASLESRNSTSLGESIYTNSSDSSGISVNFTSLTPVNKSNNTISLSQLSPEDEYPAEASAEQKASGVKSDTEKTRLQPKELVEPASQSYRQPLNISSLLAVAKGPKRGEVNNAGSSMVLDVLKEKSAVRPSYLPVESMNKSSSLTDPVHVQQTIPKGAPTQNENKTSLPLNRPQMLTVETEQWKGMPRTPAITTNHIPSCFFRTPLETISSLTDLDETPVLQNHLEFLEMSSLQFPDPITTTHSQVAPTSPSNQIHFPKSTRKIPKSPVEASSSPQIENHQEDESVVTNGTNENAKVNNAAKIVRSTKLTRSSHVTKRPQTISVSRDTENGHQTFVVHPETHKNINPECHFVVHEKLGVGKFGNVYRCESKQTHQILAMKEIKTNRLTRHTSGDVMEVAVLRAVGCHNNIACLHSAYEVQSTCFIITEYVSGGALYDRVVSEDNLDEQISASIVRQMLLGLQHIQACSVLHLDLKPENVMMVAPSGYQLKIIDFGLAYFFDPKRPRRQMAGTYIYSAPETINYEMQSFATDTWSVAVIAYELLSGITPFECPPAETPDKELTMPEVTTNIINCRYNFDDDGICDASEKAKDFIQMILKKNPKDRPNVKDCLEHPWMKMTSELPKVRREVSIRRRASALEKTRPFPLGQHHISMDNENF